MLYAPRTVFASSQIADADELMREFNRAERAVTTLDQNNLADSQITTAMAVLPSESTEALALTHSGGSLLRVDGSGSFSFPTPSENSTWTLIEDGAGDPLELEFTTYVGARVHIIGSFQLGAVSTGTPDDWRWTTRLYIDGQPGAAQATASMTDGHTVFKTNVLVREHMFLPAGTHRVTMRTRDWRSSVGSAAGISAALQWIGVIGWAR